MAGPRQPTNLILAKGTKHFSKDEIKERLSSEVQPCTDEIAAPSFLTAAQTKEFNRIAAQLKKLKIMGETDVGVLARYVVAQELYEQTAVDLRVIQLQRPSGADFTVENAVAWASMMEKLDKRLERYFKQAQTAANALGLTISSRCKLVVPVKEDEQPKQNKFAQFAVIGKNN